MQYIYIYGFIHQLIVSAIDAKRLCPRHFAAVGAFSWALCVDGPSFGVQRSRKNLRGPNSTMVPPLQMAKKVRLRYAKKVHASKPVRDIRSSRFVDVSVQIGWLGSLAWLQEGWQTNPKMLRQTKPRLAMQKVDENGPW